MTDDEHRALADESRQMQLHEAELQEQALLRRRANWVWLSQVPVIAGPLAWIGMPRINLPFFSSLSYHFARYIPVLAVLGWIGYCTGMIAALNARISGRRSSAVQNTGIFVGLLTMNFLIALVIVYVGCALIFLVHAGYL